MRVGTLDNYYGHIEIKEENNKYYWELDCHSGTNREEIPKYLYDSLMKFEKERNPTLVKE